MSISSNEINGQIEAFAKIFGLKAIQVKDSKSYVIYDPQTDNDVQPNFDDLDPDLKNILSLKNTQNVEHTNRRGE